MLDSSDTDAFYNDTSPVVPSQLPVGVPRAANVCRVTESTSSRPLAAACGNVVTNPLSSVPSGISTTPEVLRSNQACLEPGGDKAGEVRSFADRGSCVGRPLRLEGRMDCAKEATADGRKQTAHFAVSQVHGVYLAFQKSVAARMVSWKAFFHFLSFERPRTSAMVVDRVERNLRYFYMNYLVICSALSVVAALLNPIVLVVAGLCGGAAFAAGLKGETVRLGSTLVPLRTFRLGCVTVGILTVLLLAGHMVAGLLFTCAIVVSFHACFHVGVSYEQLSQKTADDAAFEV